ncbi:MAG: ATP-grasp domain-containing protein [Bacilli bacterium]|jgi:biotin carboxylase|nr:ATP-grasp domain-containing protein [Bacilli bacterium]
MKKILLLGGLRYLIPVIKSAHELGYYVITCDYLPNNIAHQYSDKYINANITDKELILKIAEEEKIDGIMSFAVDPGVLTASYVAEKMNLPGCPFESVKILQNKVLFRKFLFENGFNVPKAKGFSSYADALKELDLFNFPVIVKPTDSAGSKGVTRVDDIDDVKSAVEYALANAVSDKKVIIEEFIEQSGFSSDCDSFSIDSDLKFVSFSNQYFDSKAENPYTPSAYSWPSFIDISHQEELVSELRRLVKLLKLGTSIYNIETRVGTDGKPYIMEVSPRGGGNRLSEMLRFATGVDLIKMAVKSAVGEENDQLEMPVYNGYWAEIILHSDRDGIFDEVKINNELFEDNIVEIDLWVKKGDKVNAFRGANDAIGTIVVRFETEREMSSFVKFIHEHITVLVN